MNIRNNFPALFRGLFLILSIFLLSECKKNEYEDPTSSSTKSKPKSALPSSLKNIMLASDGVLPTSYYLINSLPTGYVKDGSVDYTTYVQAAITKNSNIVFPDFPILINDTGLIIGSNKIITFLPGSELWLKPSSKEGYSMLLMKSVTNVTLYNPVVKGDRYNHLGVTGEWGSGIAVYSSSNITINGARATDCWGDGIYLGSKDAVVSKDITISGAKLSNNRRSGISVISVDGLKLDSTYAAYTNGTSPMSGINVEPNSVLDVLKNIVITNPVTLYNSGNGIQIGLGRMLGGGAHLVDFTIINHLDHRASNCAVVLVTKPKNGVTGGSISGYINIVNPTWNKTISGYPMYVLIDQPNLKTTISSPSIGHISGLLFNDLASEPLLRRNFAMGSVTITP